MSHLIERLAALNRASFSVLGACYLAPGRFVHLGPVAYLGLLALGAVWLALAAWAAWRLCRSSREARTLYLAAAALYLACGAWVTLVYPPTTDEPHYLLLAESLLMDGDIDLANNYAALDHLKFYPVPAIDPHVVITPDGRWYAQHTIGVPLLVLPGYALAGRWGVMAILGLLAAALPVLLERLCRSGGAAAGAARTTAVLLGASAPLVFASSLVFPEVPAAVLAALAMASTGSAWVPAACAAALPWLHPRFAVLCAGLAAVHLLEHRRKGAALGWWTLCGAASGGAFLAVYHGPALAAALNVLTEHYPARLEDLGKATVTGNLGVRYLLPGIGAKLFDREFGLIPYAPWLLVLLPGAVAAFGRRGFPHRRLLLGAGAYALLTCLYRNWAGSAYPGRTLVVLLPFLAPYAAAGVAWASTGRLRRASFAGLVVLSLAIAWGLTACPVLRYTSGRDWMSARLGRAWVAAPFTWFPRFALRLAPR